MKKTLLCHFYNEEYLLPFFLEHHLKIFDRGVFIDYHSTDNSINIIRQYCPDEKKWLIFNTKEPEFDAERLDREIESFEKRIPGWKLCLNVTEFLIGDINTLCNQHSSQFFIKSVPMVDKKENIGKNIDKNTSIYKQRYHGILNVDTTLSEQKYIDRSPRVMHNHSIKYPTGRHFRNQQTVSEEQAIILWYGYSPLNEFLLKRKTQISEKVSKNDVNLGLGFHHHLKSDTHLKNHELYLPYIENLKPLINSLTKYNQ